jgi:glycogen debranching enzyme
VTGQVGIELDLAATPFSRRGSYFAVSRVLDRMEPGLYLRTVRGGARHREILRIRVGGESLPEFATSGGCLDLRSGDSRTEIALSGAGRATIRVSSGEMVLDFQATTQYDAVVRESADAWRFIDSGANRNYRVRVIGGTTRFESRWDGVKNSEAKLIVSAFPGEAVVVIDEFGSAVPHEPVEDIRQIARAAQDDFDAWTALHGGGSHPDAELTAAIRLAAFVTWGAMVPAGGALLRESMLMSKNRMTNVWSWDHCFNAMALWRDPAAAAGQLLAIFDHQDENGCLPDFVNDEGIERNFVKPPIHGWAIDHLMDRNGLTDAALTSLYEPLRRWTEWWFEHRVYGDDGIPSYNHGNDSGWDNSTVFGVSVPVQSPDLLAYLALQMMALGRIADRIGMPEEASSWRLRAAATAKTMSEKFWVDGRFVARDTHSQNVIASESLITFMPLVLGDLLPAAQFDATVRQLVAGGYLTEHGPATEPINSPEYDADGYWRGPIWAPTTLLLVDGLRRGGEAAIADGITRNFIATCTSAGMAENFDATTGSGLRDRSMTWTASVFLTMIAPLPDQGNERALVREEEVTAV